MRFRPDASEDLADAFRWYERQRPGLGREFEKAVEQTLRSLEQAPAAFPILHRDLRRVLLKRFPYAIYYRVEHNEIEIRACLHTRRHPGRWRRRA